MDDLVKNLREYVVGNFLFGRDDGSLRNGDSLMERGVMDSTGVLELIQHLEATYSIKIEDEELVPENLDSIESLSRFVARKQARASQVG